MKTVDIIRIRAAVAKISIKKRGTSEGDAQREAFLKRWGKTPQQL